MTINDYVNESLLSIVCLLLVFGAVQAQEERTIVHDGIERSFIQYTPSEYNPDSTYSLVLVLHGFTQNAEAIMNYSDFNALAEEQKFIVVYPNGINNAWNTQTGFPGGSTADDVGFLDALVDLLLDEKSIHPRRVYACGFSAGGFMSYILACELQDRLAAIASVAGTYARAALNNCQPARPFPILHIHGTDDLIVPAGGSFANISVEETLEFWQMENECAVDPILTEWPDDAGDGTRIEFFDFGLCSGLSALQYLRVINGGHTWPGASQNSGIGTTTQNLDATAAIWDFFSQFSAPVSTQTTRVHPQPIRLFPNPTAHQIEIRWPEVDHGHHFRIIRADGQEMLRQKTRDSKICIPVSSWPSGLYWFLEEGQEAIPWIKM